jgi:N utilization substance protein B
MTQRTRGREIALQVLYQAEQNAGMPPVEIRRFVERRLLGDRKLVEFAEALIAGVRAHQARIDEMISGVAENWRLDRMAAIDRNILRLGAFEMLFCPDVPTKVAINEALELAKRYSTAQSSRFVNGILDRLQAIDPAAPKATPGEPGDGRGDRAPRPVGEVNPPVGPVLEGRLPAGGGDPGPCRRERGAPFAR